MSKPCTHGGAEQSTSFEAALGAERSGAGRSPEGRRPGTAEQSRVRGALLAFEEAMAQHEGAELGDCMELKHTFSNGVYVRELTVPAGQYVMGKIHKHEHPSILAKGKIVVMSEAGVQRLEAYTTWMSPAGAKRFFYTLEDTIWITVHRTDADNAADAEDEIIAKSYEDIGMEYDKLTLSLGGMK